MDPKNETKKTKQTRLKKRQKRGKANRRKLEVKKDGQKWNKTKNSTPSAKASASRNKQSY